MRTDWQTPPPLFNLINKSVGFRVDAAADINNHLTPEWYGPGSHLGEDALTVPVWLSPAWCNPPYGRGLERWLEKFVEQTKFGNQIVALLPASVGTNWWYDYILDYSDVVFLKGRVPFTVPGREKPSQPNHDSALIFFDSTARGDVRWWDWKALLDEAQNVKEVEDAGTAK